jgi:acetyl coenzyme A synthetase (ADP forming)-like protein
MALKALFSPNAIAVIGASRSPQKVGHAVLDNLIRGGFKGRIVPINPEADKLLGLKCYASLEEFDGKIDLSVIAVPVKSVKAAVSRSLASGAKAVIIISAGFREVGLEGIAFENEIKGMCAAKGVRLMGPNCLGLINTESSMNASFAADIPVKGGISVISQSGALCMAIMDWAESRHLGLAKVISLGNKVDLNETDFLKVLTNDDQTKVIIGYLESISMGDEFIRAAEAAALKKPVCILKAGMSEAGGRAATSHTGSFVGADLAYGAAFKRSGVIRADTFESMLDYAEALVMQPLPRGDTVAIITNAGGPGIIAADAVERAGMRVADLGKTTVSALKAKSPAAAIISNPIDVLGDAEPERYAEAVTAALGNQGVDAVVVLLALKAMSEPSATAKAVAGALNGKKPVLATFLGGRENLAGQSELVKYGLPYYTSPERAVAALKAMVEYNAWQNKPPRIVTRFPVNRRRVERIIGRYKRLAKTQVNEVDAKEMLRAYDFNVSKGLLAKSVEQALEAAGQLGFPVAMKIVSPDIVHKSDIGGVKLDLGSPGAVADAFDLMMLRIGRNAPNAEIKGVYVEKMAPPGVEVIIGMTRDAQFGPMLMFGLGGIFVEVMKDVTFHLAPITADEASQMLESTKSYAMLKGSKGHSEVDLAAIASGLQRLSQLVSDFPEIQELDINPFIVGKLGAPPIVADARITIGGIGNENDT